MPRAFPPCSLLLALSAAACDQPLVQTQDTGSCALASGYLDADGDRWGAGDVVVTACAGELPLVEVDGDCDDLDPKTNPGVAEVCDGIDQDCDGLVDEDTTPGTTYADADGDGWGDESAPSTACPPPDGYVAFSGDCDDTDPEVSPDAAELCDGVDEDCDGEIDEDALDASPWYADGDGDGFGDASEPVHACQASGAEVADASDCDDRDPTVNPGATETCDGEDQDCDDAIDEDPTGAATWWYDADGDNYGGSELSEQSCEAPPGFHASADDCDDLDDAVNPDADESCNGIDDNCDGATDDVSAIDPLTWYADDDGDGYGDASASEPACDAPSGHVADDTDCDDGDAAISPDATENCDDLDNDCDGLIDDEDPGLTGAEVWYIDDDGDGYGSADYTIEACDPPPGWGDDSTDCDDLDAAVNPDADESCNGIDDNCDGATDDASAIDPLTWYADDDGDGYGDPAASELACAASSGHVADDTDCDDASGTIQPGATESCDSLDNDCDGLVDDDDPSVTGQATWYADTDADGYGSGDFSTEACNQPSGWEDDAEDCDDLDAAVNPSAADTIYDGTDSDCDGASDYDQDGDGDDSQLHGGYDCDDTDATVSPGATEVCDGVDNDCVGDTDDGGVCPCTVRSGYDDRAYLFCETPTDWSSAAAACESYGYHLVELADEDENDLVITLAGNITSASWWIGYGDSDDEDHFVDGSGVAVDTEEWDPWYAGEPNDSSTGEDCVEMWSSGLWNDDPCTRTNNYICESSSTVGDHQDNAGDDCADIRSNRSELDDEDGGNDDGEYWIDVDGSPELAWCDMSTDGGGWTQLADYDFALDDCPGDWTLEASEGVCYKGESSAGEVSAEFDALGISWSEARGAVTGRQYGSPDAFGYATMTGYDIEDPYVDGLSLSTGLAGSRDHVFTWAAGYSTGRSTATSRIPDCPSDGGIDPISDVGDDYLCASGNTSASWTGKWYTPVLWEGESFQVELDSATTEDIEARIMVDQGGSDENVGIATLELYVR